MPRFRDHVWALQHTMATLGWRAAAATVRDQRPPIARVVADIQLADLRQQPDAACLLETVSAGLGLIAAADPRRFRRLQRDVARILIIDDLRAAAAVFLNASRTCALSARYLAGGDPRVQPAMAAWLLVHEAVHARLDRLHPLPWWPGLSARMERRAMREELDFVARLPRPTYDFMREWLPGRIAQDRHATPQLRAAALRLAAAA